MMCVILYNMANIKIRRGEETILSTTGRNESSLKTTIPGGIVKQLGLHPGSIIRWVLRGNGDDIIILVIPTDAIRKGEPIQTPKRKRGGRSIGYIRDPGEDEPYKPFKFHK